MSKLGALAAALMGGTSAAAVTAAEGIQLSDDQQAAAQAELDQVVQAAETKGFNAGVEAEQSRTAAVLGSDEGRANIGLAVSLLATTPLLAADAIIKNLKAAGPAPAASTTDKPAGATTAAAGSTTQDPAAQKPGATHLDQTGKVDVSGATAGTAATTGADGGRAEEADGVALWRESIKSAGENPWGAGAQVGSLQPAQ